jgi:aspartyl-tRNA(Asn)/glutamyl-tRNA(Gln) amidotransferase subunit A
MRIAGDMASLAGYPFPDRIPLWRERLSVNLPELRYLDTLTDAGAGQYMPRAGAIAPEGITPAADTPGIAAIARQAHINEQGVLQPALHALACATRHSELNAFIELASEEALARQAALAGAAARGGSPAPLLGVPIAVKDLMAVEGFRLTGGSSPAGTVCCDHDAVAVSRLRQAGALILGMANLHELAYGITSANPHHGAVVNPRNPRHTPGGSSGGSAAAVAAGIVRAAIGTDTAGSIRIPAACCGVVGFKPSYDAISRRGAMDLGPTLDHVGPITQSVYDAALLFSVMAGQPPQVPRRLASLQGLRVGIPGHYFFEPLAPDVRRALDEGIRRIEADGATMVPVEIPGVEHGPGIQFATLCSEATAIHWRRLVQVPESLGEDVRVRLEIGQMFPAIWYTRAQGARTRLAASLANALAGVDILLTPTLRTTAPAAGSTSVTLGGLDMPLHTAMTNLTLPFNLAGLPAITLPCGHGANGLPVGLQLAGKLGDDWRLLAVAHRVEALLRPANQT